MTSLIVGSTGFLGNYLFEHIDAIDKNTIGVSKSDSNYNCNITDKESVATLMDSIKPEYVFHCAAMTNVDQCEAKPRLAMETNCIGTRNLVEHLPKGCRFVYISTDMVYSGPKAPHREFSISESPVNVYGLTKYMGEFEASKAPNHLILRTNMYGKRQAASSLAHNLLELFRRDGLVHLFHDSYFNPLHAKTLSRLIVTAAMASHKIGIYNLGSTGGMSKLEFAVRVSQILDIPINQARPIPAATFGSITRGPRPNDTRMDISRFEQCFAVALPRMDKDMLNLKAE